jgi:hypothetical protein
MRRIGWAPNSIPIYVYIQQDATLHSLFVSGNCSTCFGWYFHPSSEPHTTVSTASGICHTVIAICLYRGRVGTDLSVMWVAYALHISGTLVPIIKSFLLLLHSQPPVPCIAALVACSSCVLSQKEHSCNTQPAQRHTVPEAVNAVKVEGSWWWAQGFPKHVERNKRK